MMAGAAATSIRSHQADRDKAFLRRLLWDLAIDAVRQLPQAMVENDSLLSFLDANKIEPLDAKIIDPLAAAVKTSTCLSGAESLTTTASTGKKVSPIIVAARVHSICVDLLTLLTAPAASVANITAALLDRYTVPLRNVAKPHIDAFDSLLDDSRGLAAACAFQRATASIGRFAFTVSPPAAGTTIDDDDNDDDGDAAMASGPTRNAAASGASANANAAGGTEVVIYLWYTRPTILPVGAALKSVGLPSRARIRHGTYTTAVKGYLCSIVKVGGVVVEPPASTRLAASLPSVAWYPIVLTDFPVIVRSRACPLGQLDSIADEAMAAIREKAPAPGAPAAAVSAHGAEVAAVQRALRAAYEAAGEDMFDCGGYLISKGTEKVIRIRSDQRENQFICVSRRAFERSSSLPNNEAGTTIRCIPPTVPLYGRSNVFMTQSVTGVPIMALGRTTTTVPALMVLRALVSMTDQDAYEFLMSCAADTPAHRERCAAALGQLAERAEWLGDSCAAWQAALGNEVRRFFSMQLTASAWADQSAQWVGQYVLRSYVLAHLTALDLELPIDGTTLSAQAAWVDECAAKVDVMRYALRRAFAVADGAPLDNADSPAQLSLIGPAETLASAFAASVAEMTTKVGFAAARDVKARLSRSRTAVSRAGAVVSLVLQGILAPLHPTVHLPPLSRFLLPSDKATAPSQQSVVAGGLFSGTGRGSLPLATMTRLVATGTFGSKANDLTVGQESGLCIVADRINTIRLHAQFQAIHRGARIEAMRTADARMLSTDAFGFLCSVQSPDGAPCGVLNHMCHDAIITARLPAAIHARAAALVARVVVQVGGRLPDARAESDVPVIVDGRVVAYVHPQMLETNMLAKNGGFVTVGEWLRAHRATAPIGLSGDADAHAVRARMANEYAARVTDVHSVLPIGVEIAELPMRVAKWELSGAANTKNPEQWIDGSGFGVSAAVLVFVGGSRIMRPVVPLADYPKLLADAGMATCCGEADAAAAGSGALIGKSSSRSSKSAPAVGGAVAIGGLSTSNGPCVTYVGPLEAGLINIRSAAQVLPRGLAASAFTHREATLGSQLSMLARMNPFFETNPAARNLFQLQMSKQTIGIPTKNITGRADHKTYMLTTPQTPLTHTLDYARNGLDEVAQTMNVIVAVVSYTAMDMEDAVVLSRAAVERGLFHGVVFKSASVDPTLSGESEAKSRRGGKARKADGSDSDSDADSDEPPPADYGTARAAEAALGGRGRASDSESERDASSRASSAASDRSSRSTASSRSSASGGSADSARPRGRGARARAVSDDDDDDEAPQSVSRGAAVAADDGDEFLRTIGNAAGGGVTTGAVGVFGAYDKPVVRSVGGRGHLVLRNVDGIPTRDGVYAVGPDGLPAIGARVKHGTVIASVCVKIGTGATARYVAIDSLDDAHRSNLAASEQLIQGRGKIRFVDHGISTLARVHAVRVTAVDADGDPMAFNITYRIDRTVVVGDKVASRHGQKGTVSLRVSDVDLPFGGDGVRPDLLINPHAFPSRMTIGMFYDSLSCKAAALNGRYTMAAASAWRAFDNSVGVASDDDDNVDAPMVATGTGKESKESRRGKDKDGKRSSSSRGAALDKAAAARAAPPLRHEAWGEALLERGYQRHGHDTYYSGATGDVLQCDVFIGPVPYQRLRHMVEDKWQAREMVGGINSSTLQPIGGRSKGGGTKVGEMERDALLAHGCTAGLNDRFLRCGNATRMPVCRDCGCFTNVDDPTRDLMIDPVPHAPTDPVRFAMARGAGVHGARTADRARALQLSAKGTSFEYNISTEGRMRCAHLPRINCSQCGSKRLGLMVVPFTLRMLAMELATVGVDIKLATRPLTRFEHAINLPG